MQLLSSKYELIDRIKVLDSQFEKSRSNRRLTGIFYCVAVVALFVASYWFVILPAFWESPDVPVPAEYFIPEESEGIFRAEETFLVDNGDGTFSLYIDGQFSMYMDYTNEAVKFFPVRERE